VIRRPEGEAAPGHRTRVLLEPLDEVDEGFDRGVGRDEQRLVFALEARQGNGLFKGHRRLVDDRSPDEAQTDDKERRIPLLRADEPGETDGAAGSRDVHDLDAGRELLGEEYFLDRPCQLIVASARSRGGDDLETLELLGPGRYGRHEAARAQGKQ
jgi:hypothetical protein